MKKIFLVLCLLLFARSVSGEVVGRYSAFGKNYFVEASLSDKGCVMVNVEVNGDGCPVVMLSGEHNIRAFCKSLTEVSALYRRWTIEVGDCRPAEHSRYFEVDFPYVTIVWNDCHHSLNYRTRMKFFFLVRNYGNRPDIFIGASGNVAGGTLSESPVKWNMMFNSPDELDELIGFLKYGEICRRLGANGISHMNQKTGFFSRFFR